ncbi:hypothetical protein SUDANB140_01105 [Streptomyces sp. enrichment culture]
MAAVPGSVVNCRQMSPRAHAADREYPPEAVDMVITSTE